MIMIADDKYVVQAVMKIIFEELGLSDRVIFCDNGEEVIDFFKLQLSELKCQTAPTEGRNLAKPVALLLMEINMLMKNGLETKKEVCELYNQFNDEQESSQGTLADKVTKLLNNSKVSILRPFICYQTDLSDAGFQNSFILPEEKADCVISKPMQKH